MKLKPYKMNDLRLYNVEIEPIYEGGTLKTLILRADGEEIHIKAGDYGTMLNVFMPDREEVEIHQTSLRQIEHRPAEPEADLDEGIPF